LKIKEAGSVVIEAYQSKKSRRMTKIKITQSWFKAARIAQLIPSTPR
jgi:hypothetical protein